MLHQGAEWTRSRPGSPFSTSDDGEAWMDAWCRQCRHDVDEDCPLVTIAICGSTPAVWKPTGSGEKASKYRCLEWMPRSGG